MDQLIIPEFLYIDLVEYCAEQLPKEACGLLSGNDHVIRTVWKLKNQSKSNNKFFVDQTIIEKTYNEIKSKNEIVIATFHSHPTTAALPSYVDIKYHLNPNILMIIISFKFKTPKVKCYKISNNNYNEYPIQIKSLPLP